MKSVKKRLRCSTCESLNRCIVSNVLCHLVYGGCIIVGNSESIN